MEYKITTKSVLHQLGISKSYSGYDYILYAFELIEQDENVLTGITKILYIEIARKFHTSHICVERNIRKVIEVIWKNHESNHTLLLKIFGCIFVESKPSNKEFLELLYAYIKSHNLFEKILHKDNFICPISKDVCIAYTKIVEKLIDL